MSEQHNTMSRTAGLLYQLGIPVTFLVLLFSSPRTAISVPCLALPTVALLRLRSKLAPFKQPDLETLIWTYLGSGTLGLAMVATIQPLIGYPLALLFFGSRTDDYLNEFGRTSLDDISQEERQKRVEMVWTWQYFIMLLIFTFVLAGMLEEVMKYIAVSYIRRRQGNLHAFEYIGLAIASAVGFSTIENLGFVYASAQVDSAYMTALTLLERIVIAMPGHSLMGVLTAVNMIRRDLRGVQLQPWQVLYPAILYHGFFDLTMFGVSAADGNVGWIHPKQPSRILLLLVLALSMLGTLVLHVTRALRELQLDA